MISMLPYIVIVMILSLILKRKVRKKNQKDSHLVTRFLRTSTFYIFIVVIFLLLLTTVYEL